MEQSPLRLIKRCAEYIPIEEINEIPRNLRGIYVLYFKRPRIGMYDVVYVGMATSSIRGRLKTHRRRKQGLWSHCSIFEVWDNIRGDEILELEGLFRHIYKKDSRANRLNKQKGFKKIKQVTRKNYWEWDQ
jgi:hypothetical protein